MRSLNCLPVFTSVLAIRFLCGQTPTGQVSGTISDASSASIPNAVIRVVNTAKGIERVTTSNEAGAYAVPALEPGIYKVVIEKEGFRTATRDGIELNVNSNLRLDYRLELGSVTEAVLVQASAPLLQTSDASLGAVVPDLPCPRRGSVPAAEPARQQHPAF
jgi:hypothetical protein